MLKRRDNSKKKRSAADFIFRKFAALNDLCYCSHCYIFECIKVLQSLTTTTQEVLERKRRSIPPEPEATVHGNAISTCVVVLLRSFSILCVSYCGRIVFRLGDGTKLTRRFLKTDECSALFDYVEVTCKIFAAIHAGHERTKANVDPRSGQRRDTGAGAAPECGAFCGYRKLNCGRQFYDDICVVYLFSKALAK